MNLFVVLIYYCFFVVVVVVVLYSVKEGVVGVEVDTLTLEFAAASFAADVSCLEFCSNVFASVIAREITA